MEGDDDEVVERLGSDIAMKCHNGCYDERLIKKLQAPLGDVHNAQFLTTLLRYRGSKDLVTFDMYPRKGFTTLLGDVWSQSADNTARKFKPTII